MKKSFIFIILAISLALLFLPFSKAQVGCCELTKSGAVCQEVDGSECEPGNWTQTSCESAYACKMGCCIDNQQGVCTQNTPRKSCQLSATVTFNEDADCKVGACTKGCCVIGLTPYYVTDIGCKQLAKSLGAQYIFQSGMSQQDCIDSLNKLERGCCKTDGACLYMLDAECDLQGGNKLGGYCAQPPASTYCTQCSPYASKGCVDFDEDVHYFDSCGNPEDVFMDCNNATNSRCQVVDGEAKCVGTQCTDSFGTHNYGSSWCGYYDENLDPLEKVDPDKKLGRNAIGWSAWTYYCGANGTIKVIPSKPGGKQLCIEFEKGDNGYADYILNPADTCSTLTEDQCKDSWACFWTDNFTEYSNMKSWTTSWWNKKIPAGFEDKASNLDICNPDVIQWLITPGTRFSRDIYDCLRGLFRKREAGTPALTKCLPKYPTSDTENCNLGSAFVTVYEKNNPAVTCAGWRCMQNCEAGGADPDLCTGGQGPKVNTPQREANWTIAMAKRCRSLGKCGAYINIAKARTTKGIVLKRSGDKDKWIFWNKNIPATTLQDPEEKTPYSKFDFNTGFWEKLADWATWPDRYVYYDFQCLPWQAPPGGENCGECNKDPLKPCNEDRCSVLGAACTYNNDTGKCFWENQDDKTAPTVVSCKKNIQGTNYDCGTSAPCVKAWIPIKFNMTTDERAQCIWAPTDTASDLDFDNPLYYFGDNQYLMEHNFELKFSASQNGSYTVYYQCRDRNDNKGSVGQISFSVCNEPDTIPPLIIATSPATDSKISGNIQRLEIYIYVNEPATCKWSKTNIQYKDMKSELCNATEVFGNDFYCKTNLTGIQPEIINQFYIRCNDSSGNVMAESYSLKLIGTKALYIANITPEKNSIVNGCGVTPEINVSVQTEEGIDDGNALCTWTKTPWNNLIEFNTTGTTSHSATVPVSVGSNTISIQCTDGTNYARNSTTFTVKIDKEAPNITRIYKEGGNLKIHTSDIATCTFNKRASTCNFDATDWYAAANFTETNSLVHSTPWRAEPWYIKCYDNCTNGAKQQDPCIKVTPQEFE
jgi:hypothetical protein